MEARTLDPGTIGWAVAELRRGARVRRTGWPRGMWLAYVPPPATPVPPLPLADPLTLDIGRPPPGSLARLPDERRRRGPGSPLHPTLVLHDRVGAVAGFAVRQHDLLATDWEMVS